MPKNKKRASSKHNDDDSSSDSDYEEENVVLNPKEYSKLLQQLFPSEHMSNKIECMSNTSKNKKNKNKKKRVKCRYICTIAKIPIHVYGFRQLHSKS